MARQYKETRQQRRSRARKQAKEPPHSQLSTLLSRSWKLLLKVPGMLYGLLGAAAVVGGLIFLFPWLSIERGESLDSQNPYASTFDVSNEGPLPATTLSVACTVNFTTPSTRFENGGVIFTNFAHRLTFHHKVTPPCFQSVSSHTVQDGARLTITIYYSVLGIPHFHQSFDFEAIRGDNGEYHWIYAG